MPARIRAIITLGLLIGSTSITFAFNGPPPGNPPSGNGSIVTDASNRVGIGTAAPDQALTIKGGMLHVASGATLTTTPGSSAGSGLFIGTDPTSGESRIQTYWSAGTTFLTFHTNSGGAASVERARIDANGLTTTGFKLTTGAVSGYVLTSDVNGVGTWQAGGISSLNGQVGAAQTFANDTNVTVSSASNVHTIGWSGTLSVARGGTGASTGAAARGNLGAAAFGANSDITSLSGLTTPLSATQGGTAQSTYAIGDMIYASAANTLAKRAIGTAGQVLTVSGGVPTWAAPAGGVTSVTASAPLSSSGGAAPNISLTGTIAAANGGTGQNSSFWTGVPSMSAGTWSVNTQLPVVLGGTGATTASGARTNLGAAASGANADIFSLSGLTTPLSATQGGTAQSAYNAGDLLYSSTANTLSRLSAGTANQVLTISSFNGLPIWATQASGVGGSGTTNYLSKFTAGTTLGNSQVFDNGTTVGIGTAAPAATDQVEVANSSGARVTASDNGGASRRYLLLQAPTSVQTYARVLGYQAGIGAQNLALEDAGGNVGVGMVAPGYKLDVSGDVNVSGVYRQAGVGGTSATCSAGQVLQTPVIAGGIVTGGTCVTPSGGTVTNVTASSPLASSGGATPNISLSGTVAVANGGTGAATAATARANLGAAASGANSDITSLSGLTTALSVAQGGTGAATVAGARTNLGAAASGANGDITSLSGLTTALSASQGGTGLTTVGTANQVLGMNGSASGLEYKTLTAGSNITITNSAGNVTIAAAGGGTVTNVTASSPLASSGGATPNISLSGTVAVANGGTGATALAANNVLLGNGTSPVAGVAPGASGNVLTSNGTSWISSTPELVSGVLIGSRVFSTPGSGTYTPTVGARSIMVELVGGGGSGAGDYYSASQCFGAAGGGGSGAYTRKYYNALAASYTYTVGAGGAAPNPRVNGNAGGLTSFDNGGTQVTAPGGGGGLVATALHSRTMLGAAGDAGVSGINGDVAVAGNPGGFGYWRWNNYDNYQIGISGNGGSSVFGGGARGLIEILDNGTWYGDGNRAGLPGTNYGAGGSGAMCGNQSTNYGGAGAGGVIIIAEYK